MSFVQHYTLTAEPAAAGDMRAALVALKAAVAELPGSLGAELLEDAGGSGTFVFIERWRSAEDRAGAGKLLPPAVMGAIRAAAAGPPGVLGLHPV